MNGTCELCGQYGKVVRVRNGAIYATIRLAHEACADEWKRRYAARLCTMCGINPSAVAACCSMCARGDGRYRRYVA